MDATKLRNRICLPALQPAKPWPTHLSQSTSQSIQHTKTLTILESDEADYFRMDGRDLQNECSKIEYMAQKQNRVEQKLLTDRLLDIEKEVTLSQLAHRMLIKQLKYDLLLMKKSTGHSPLARPPTGQPDTRVNIRKQSRLPSIQALQQMEIVAEEPQNLEENPEMYEEKGDNINSNVFLTESTVPPEHDDGETPAKGEDEAEPKQNQAVDESSQKRKSHGRLSFLVSPSYESPERNSTYDRRQSLHIAARIEESKRIMNMPSIYQTVKMKKNRNLNRVLPPIAVQESLERKTPEAQEDSDTKHTGSKSVGSNSEIRISFTPETKLKKENDKKKLSELLQESLKKAAAAKAEERRKKQQEKLRRNLAIERPVGLYRPDNMKLIRKTFKKEDLYNQHKLLLEQNDSRDQIPVPALVGSNKLNSKLQAFLQHGK